MQLDHLIHPPLSFLARFLARRPCSDAAWQIWRVRGEVGAGLLDDDQESMHDYPLSPACFRMLLYVRARCQVVRRMPGNSDASRLRRVFELTVAALGRHFAPAVSLNQLDSVTNLGPRVHLIATDTGRPRRPFAPFLEESRPRDGFDCAWTIVLEGRASLVRPSKEGGRSRRRCDPARTTPHLNGASDSASAGCPCR